MSILEGINHGFVWNLTNYRQHVPYLTRYLSTLLASIGRTERRVAAARYLEGLLLPEKKKFIRPLAERLHVDPQSLQQVIANSPWDDQEVWSTLRREIIPLFEPLDICVVHERAWAKQGGASVGVSNQRCGANGKRSRCQVSLELLLSDGSMAVPIASRLYVPQDWNPAPSRKKRPEIPEGVEFGNKPALILQLLTQTVRDGIAPHIIVGDSTYGNDCDFRATLLRVGLEFFLEIDTASKEAGNLKVFQEPTRFKSQPHGSAIEEVIKKIPDSDWKNCSWTTREGMPRRTRLALREVFLDSETEPQSVIQRLWLVVDWPAGLPRPYRCYLASFHHTPSLSRCLRLSRHRSYLEQYQRVFECDLDLACYQGRSWAGFHHHLVLAFAAYLFVLCMQQRACQGFWIDINEGFAIDPAIATETARLLSVLSRSTLPRNFADGAESDTIPRSDVSKYSQRQEGELAI
jgi:SRSO17 transposase